MSAVPIEKAKPQPVMVVNIFGRVEETRSYNGSVYTRLVCPAASAYDKPSVVEIRSKRRIASKGEEITVSATLGGYPERPFYVTDKETGERVQVRPVSHTLDLVD